VKSDTRLFAILARKSSQAVIFRRGPTRQVLLIRWDTSNDSFEMGQWFKGRIYERRCDLSPDGSLLIYFASKQVKPFYTWTAVSRPPYLTALALWPKGDCWGGGGLFETGRKILLNHRAGEMTLAEGFAVSRLVKVEPFGAGSGWGEDNPIWPTRLVRDGWRLDSKGTPAAKNPKLTWEYSPPITYSKAHPIDAKRYRLEMEIHGIHEKNGPWYATEHAVLGEEIDPLGRSEWADWLPDGDLVFSRGGELFRVRWENGISSGRAECIADFSALKFENKEAPKRMTRW